jgi:YVTN family beta-propeller protein
VQVRDDDGGVSDILTTVVVVNNVAPTVNAGADQSTNEGTSIAFTGSFTNPGAGTHTFSWNFGDGSPAVTDNQTPNHTYKDNGTFTVTLTVTDQNGGVGTDTLTVTVYNVAPTLEGGPDQTLNEGETVSLTSATFIDPGIQDTHTATINWKDGSPVEAGAINAGTVSGSHVYPDDGVFTVDVCVSDDDKGVGCDSLQVIVNNVAPTVNAGQDSLTEEGTSIAFTGSFTDPGADTHTFSWNFGDGSPAVKGSLTPAHAYKDNGTFTVSLKVTDDDGGAGADTVIVIVTNRPPVISVSGSTTVDEGSPMALKLSASDAGEDDVVSLQASVLPDGASFTPTPGRPATGTLRWTPAFTQSGSYTGVTVTATDDDGGTDIRTVSLTVNETGQPVLAVTNLIDDTVSLIDQQVNGVVSTVGVGHQPVAAAFYNFQFDGINPPAKLYVAERNDNTLSVLVSTSASALALSKVIQVGDKPKGVGVSPYGTQVWAANRNSDSLSIIDPATDTVIVTVPLGLQGSSGGGIGDVEDDQKSVALGFSPDDRYAYVVARNSGTLVVVDKAQALADPANAVVASVEVGDMPEALAVDPAGELVYVANWNGRNVSVVDVSTPTVPVVLDRVAVGKHPDGMALLSDGSKLYVTNRDSDTVSVLEVGPSPFYLTLIKTIAVGKKPLGIAATRDGSFVAGDYVYVANQIDDTVSVIDAVTDQVITTILVGMHPSGVAAGILPTAPRS